jgi:hypothetical protein
LADPHLLIGSDLQNVGLKLLLNRDIPEDTSVKPKMINATQSEFDGKKGFVFALGLNFTSSSEKFN